MRYYDYPAWQWMIDVRGEYVSRTFRDSTGVGPRANTLWEKAVIKSIDFIDDTVSSIADRREVWRRLKKSAVADDAAYEKLMLDLKNDLRELKARDQ